MILSPLLIAFSHSTAVLIAAGSAAHLCSQQAPTSLPLCCRDKKKKEASPDDSATGDNDDEDQSDNDKDAIVWKTDTSKAAVEKRAAEQLSDAMAGMVTRGNVEAEQEEASKRADREAAAARKVSQHMPARQSPKVAP